jgi:DNA-binding PadR family transcriptional regulator
MDEIGESGAAGRHLPLHPLEFQILLSLTDGVTHAYEIVQGIEARQPAWNRILPTNLYRRIRRLASSGLIEEVDVDTPADERKRRYFAITDLGREVAGAEATRLRGLLLEAESAGVLPARGRGR